MVCFIWAPDEEGQFEPGRCNRWWLHNSLKALSASLRRLGSRLVLRTGRQVRPLPPLLLQPGERDKCREGEGDGWAHADAPAASRPHKVHGCSLSDTSLATPGGRAARLVMCPDGAILNTAGR